jgi:putative glutamine amidotransferase
MSTTEDRPVIGVAWPQRDYVEALTHAGAEIRELTPANDRLPGALASCDGILLTGGPDVDPSEYGEERHPTVEVDPVRDEYELALAREALAQDLPIFAICRGAQLLNVAAGGTLIQDVPSQHPTTLTHSRKTPVPDDTHEIAVTPDTCLSVLLAPELASTGRIGVNSRHHQSVKRPAPGFVVSATAPDGVVEAIEKPGAAFCLGVQWHPENFWQTGRFSTLFSALVEAATRHRQAR